MKIWHRVSFNGEHKPDFLDYLKKANLDFEISPLPNQQIGLVYFDIDESNPKWSEVDQLIKSVGASDIYETFFTEDEVLNAEWLSVGISFTQGYPQPEKEWLKNKPNYTNYCRSCGTFKQVDSFQLKKEPFLRKNVFFSLLWASTFFAQYSVFDTLEEHNLTGYEQWDAIIRKTQQPSTTVAQLSASNTTQHGLVNSTELLSTACLECGITKYIPHKRGIMYYKQDAMPVDVDIVETQEWFGDGHMAFRELLVSQRFAELAIKEDWKGVRLNVVKLV